MKKLIIIVPTIVILVIMIILLVVTPPKDTTFSEYMNINTNDIVYMQLWHYGSWYDIPEEDLPVWKSYLSSALTHQWSFSPFQHYTTGDSYKLKIITFTAEKTITLECSAIELNVFYNYHMDSDFFNYINEAYQKYRNKK